MTGDGDGDGDRDACIPEEDASLCGTHAQCGDLEMRDNCGTIRLVQCGTCAFGNCEDNVCNCYPESDAVFCERLDKSCGSFSGKDNCGKTRGPVDCGSCKSGMCSSDNTCCMLESDEEPKCPNTEVIARDQESPAGIAVDTQAVYWVNVGDGTVRRARFSDLDVETIAYAQSKPVAIAVNATHVFWTVANIADPTGRIEGLHFGVRRKAKGSDDGPVVAALSPNEPYPGETFDLDVTPDYLLWTESINSGMHALVRAPLSAEAQVGENITAGFYEPTTKAQALAANSDGVVWVETDDAFSGAASVYSLALSGGSPTRIFSSSFRVGGIAVDDDSVFIPNATTETFNASAVSWRVKEVPIGGGSPKTASLAVSHGASAFSEDGVRVDVFADSMIAFSSENGTEYRIQRISLLKSEADYVADSQGAPGDFVLDADYVYWTEPATGRVMRARWSGQNSAREE